MKRDRRQQQLDALLDQRKLLIEERGKRHQPAVTVPNKSASGPK